MTSMCGVVPGSTSVTVTLKRENVLCMHVITWPHTAALCENCVRLPWPMSDLSVRLSVVPLVTVHPPVHLFMKRMCVSNRRGLVGRSCGATKCNSELTAVAFEVHRLAGDAERPPSRPVRPPPNLREREPRQRLCAS